MPSPRQKGCGKTTTEAGGDPVKGIGRSILNLVVMFFTAVGAFGQTNFGSQALGTSTSQSVTLTARVAGTVADVRVLAMGNPNLDYSAGSGTCASAGLLVNSTCTLEVNFAPKAPGQRFGAVVLLDGSNKVLGASYLVGTGLGGLPVLLPGNEITYAGSGAFDLVGDGQPATIADLNLPSSVALDAAGNLYIADSAHDRIRKVDATTHIMSTVAGNGNTGFSGDLGPATGASLNSPSGVALDGAGNLYIADTKNNAVRVVSAATGIISTFAGDSTGNAGSSGENVQATSAWLNQPWGVTVDGAGNVYIADTNNHKIRKVDIATGVITTVAGSGIPDPVTGAGGYSGDGGLATAAKLNFPYAVAFDVAGNMFIPDSGNNCVRKVDLSGKISTYAGNGTTGFGGDGGAASTAQLWSPEGVTVDPAGNVYIADSQNNAIRKVSAKTGKISTPIQNISGESVVSLKLVGNTLSRPIGLALDGYGNLYVADYYYLRVRQIQLNVIAVDFLQTPVRQGTVSLAKPETLENDGNAPFTVASITPDANSALDAPSTTCTGTTLAKWDSCVLGVEFAPSVAGNPLVANIGVSGQSVDSPLNVVLVGNAPKVNDTTTTLTATPNPSSFAQTVSIKATVTTGTGTGALTGTVTFFDGATKLQSSVSVSGGVAVFNTSGLTVGTHSLTATYSGETLHFPSTSTPVVVQVVNEATSTVIAPSANPTATGSSVTFTATVSVSGGGGVTPDGTVTFFDGATPLSAPVTLTAAGTSGTATYSTSTLIDGVHPITAVFSGDAATYVLGSTSGVLSQDVLAPSTVAVVSGTNPSIYGSSVTFTATVTSSSSLAPSGVINFLDGGTQIGTANITGTSGAATFSTTALAAGTHPITAAYKGSPNNGPGVSPPIIQTVNLTQTTTSIAANPTPAIAGTPVTLTAKVAAVTGSTTVTGTITFTDGTVKLGTATIGAGGVASISPTLAPGAHAISASYGGDSNDNPSASTPLAVNVVLATTSVSLTTSGSPAVVLSQVVFTATVSGNGGTPTGSVVFAVDGVNVGTSAVDAKGKATFSDSALLVGTHAVVATYSGDTNDNPSTSAAVSEIVQPISTVTSIGQSTSSGPVPQAILVATTIGNTGPTPAGTINFTYESSGKIIGTATVDSGGVATMVPDLPPGNYSVVAIYSGDSIHSPSTSKAVTFSATPIGFGVAVNPASITVVSSQNKTVTINLISNNGFADSIGMGCLSLPAAVNCHFSANSVALKAGQSQSVQLTIDTNLPLSGGTVASKSSGNKSGMSLAALAWPASLLFGFAFWRFRKRNAAALLAALALFLAGAIGVTGCGASFSQKTAAPGTYTIQVGGVGTGSNISHYQSVSLTITK